MTDNNSQGGEVPETALVDELRVRRGRIQALTIATAIHHDQPEEADRVYRHEQDNEAIDELLAGAVAMFLAVARSFAELTGTDVEGVIDHLWQTEAGAMVTLSEIDNLTTTNDEQKDN